MRISDWSSDVCSSDLLPGAVRLAAGDAVAGLQAAPHGDLVLELAAVAPAPVGAVADRRYAPVDAAVPPLDALADRHRHGALLRPDIALLLAFVQPVDELQREDGIERHVVVAALPIVAMARLWIVVEEIGRASCRERVCQYV